MINIREQVIEFHKAMNITVLDTPQIPSDKVIRLRLNLITEEFLETLVAAGIYIDDVKEILLERLEVTNFNVDLPSFIDGLADLDYVNEGCRLEFGVNGIPVAAEVHRANMTKKDGPIRDDGKRLKPPGFKPPAIYQILKEQGWENGK